MPRPKRKWLLTASEKKPTITSIAAPTKYFRMKDGKAEVGVPFWTLYGLYQRGELRAASLTPGGALYVARSDFDLLWKKKVEACQRQKPNLGAAA
jgi:hypothetical protein